MNITYNNITYQFDRYSSYEELLKQEGLRTLPMSSWKELFEKKDGFCTYDVLIAVLEKCIEYYDTSSEVNSFYYNDKKYWFDKATRVGLWNLVNCSESTVQLVLGDEIIELSVDKAKEFLTQLEQYAAKCFIATKKNLLNIRDLHSVGDIINYDYICNYPEKIVLNV